MAVGIFINGFSSIFTGLNFIVTMHKLRAPGMTWFRLPLFVWTLYSTSLIFVLATPVLAITLTLVALERGFGVGIFDPRLGGDPLLFQHLFWFYSHPAVYIMILPAMGVVSELIAAFSRKRDLRLQLHRLCQPRHRVPRLPRLGPPHVRQRPVDLCRDDLLAAELSSSPFRRRSRSSTGRPRSTRARSRSTRRCSMRLASSRSSPSAA